MVAIKKEIIDAARLIWDYLKLDMPVSKSDGIVIFCSNDLRVAEYASSLYHDGYADWICPTGGTGRLTYDLFHKPEALAFLDVLVNNGVPTDAIFPEIRATNSAENVFYSRELITSRGLPHGKLIILQKPYVERRTLATVTWYWPGQVFTVSSPPLTFDNYPFPGFTQAELIHVLAGEFQRMRLYADRGWQSPQTVPETAMAANKTLTDAGYTGQLADPSAIPSKPPKS
jgi:hypothetical protein